MFLLCIVFTVEIMSKSLSCENMIVCFKSNFMSRICLKFKHESLISLPCDALVKASLVFMVMMVVICSVVGELESTVCFSVARLCVCQLLLVVNPCVELGWGAGGVP